MNKYFKKTVFIVLTYLIFVLPNYANEISKYIRQSDFELKSTVSVFVKDLKNNDVLYKKNEQKLLNPASILKALTFGTAYKVLGQGYKFETALYKDKSNNLYVKLGGDTLLTEPDLEELFAQFKQKNRDFKINNIYIDDTIIDKTPYPSGWMEDDIWPVSRAITPYIVDNNYTNILIKRSSLSKRIDIIQNDDYKLPIVNELNAVDKESGIQKIKFERLYGDESSIVNLKGDIARDENILLPVLKPEINFNIKLQNAIKKNEIKFNRQIISKKIPAGAYKAAYVSHTIEDISKKILLNSDNFSAEVVFKVAAAKYINYAHPATLDDAINMFNKINEKHITDGIKIADGSGVSRYNLVSSEFVSNVLEDLVKNTNIKPLFATSSEGTLNERLLFLKDNLRAKTGTLSKMSSIAGFVTTEKNTDTIFVIIVQNSPKRKAVLKNFENTIVSLIYKEY